MADDPPASGESGSQQGPPRERPSATAETLEVLRRLSLRTKALVISSEYTRRQMEPAELRRVLQILAPTAEERRKAVQAVEEELRAARYPMGEIVRLVSGLTSESEESAAPPPPPQNPNVVVTRKVRSPNLMAFEKFEFGSPGKKPDARSGGQTDERAGGESPEEKVAEGVPAGVQAEGKGGAAGAPPPLRFVSGGESAPPEAKGHGDLPSTGARFAPPSDVASGGGAATPTVLVADDDGRARMMYRAKLEESGFAVVEAKDGIEAWDYIQGGGVHCAVMDMKMPGYHGLEVLGRMVDANLTLPVVVVSAFDQLANEFVVATYPELKFLTKPAPPEHVVEAVSSFLRPGKRVET